MRALATIRAILEERTALMAPARRLRLKAAEDVLADFAAGRPIRVLDAGCGDGLLSMALAKRHPAWTIVGIDLREDMLAGARARARGRGLDNVSFEAADLLRPLSVSGFDAVVALECLSEIPDDEAALRALFGAAAPGAVVALASFAGAFAGAAASPLTAPFAPSGESERGWNVPRTRSPGPSTPGVSGRPSALKIPVPLLYET